MKPLLTAAEAAEATGYKTVARWRSAVERGIMPRPIDPDARPALWSWPQIEARLNPQENRGNHDPALAAFESKVGMR